MKCPICGQELRPGKKDPNYLLCYNCKKKFKVPQNRAVQKRAPERREPVNQEAPHRKIRQAAHEDVEEELEQKYSNIPPKSVRKKREDEMRKAYDEMLAVEDGKKKNIKPAKVEEDYDDYDDIYEEDEKLSKAPVIILGIAIVVVAAVIVYMLLK